jgi:nucleoside-diphosphate-sugar epimerase
MSKILVTGGAGFIGSNVAKELISSGHDTVVLDNLSSGRKELLPKNAHFIKGSVDCDRDLKKCFALKPEYVIHLAALFANQNSIEHPQKDLMVNGMGTIKVLEYSQTYEVKKILYASTSCVYGNKERTEETDEVFYLETPYAITKLLGERYCRFWVRQHGLDIVIVRLFNTYGPGEYPGKYRNVIPNFFKLALENKPLPITGDGNETRDFTYVTDVASGIIGALFSPTKAADIFNLASGRETSILDLAKMVNNITGNPAGIEFFPRRKWDGVLRRCGSIAKASVCFGYKPRVDLSAGLGLTHEWIKKHI